LLGLARSAGSNTRRNSPHQDRSSGEKMSGMSAPSRPRYHARRSGSAAEREPRRAGISRPRSIARLICRWVAFVLEDYRVDFAVASNEERYRFGDPRVGLMRYSRAVFLPAYCVPRHDAVLRRVFVPSRPTEADARLCVLPQGRPLLFITGARRTSYAPAERTLFDTLACSSIAAAIPFEPLDDQDCALRLSGRPA